MGTFEEFITKKDYQAAIMFLEQRILGGDPLDTIDLSSLETHLHSSPLLLKAHAEQLFYTGELGKAKEYFSLALKGFASQTFQEYVLSTFAYLALINLRIGEPYEAETILHFLQEEYRRQEEMLNGDVFLALALGSQLIPMEIPAKQLFEQAICMYDSVGRFLQGSVAQVELMLALGQEMPKEEWAERCAIMQQRVKLNKAEQADCEFLYGLFEKQRKNWVKSHYFFSLVEGSKHYMYSSLAKIEHLQSTLALEKDKHRAQASPTLLQASLEYIERELQILNDLRIFTEDLVLKFTLTQLKFEIALVGQHKELSRQLFNEAQAIQRLTLLRSQEVHLTKMKSQLNVLEKQVEHSNKIAPLHIKCFGGLRFERAGEEIRGLHWKRKKAQELFLYLLLQPHYTATREQVAEALFEGLEPKKMANQLYVITHQLKQVLSQQVSLVAEIVTRDGVIRLPSQYLDYVDIEQYLTLVQVANRLWIKDRELAIELYEKAYQLYEPFVPEMQYLDWLDRFRDQLEDRQVGLLKKLGQYAWGNASFDQAETYFREWIEIRPLEEEAYQHLMRLLIQRERETEALSLYKLMEKLLREELDSVPSPVSKQIVFGVT